MAAPRAALPIKEIIKAYGKGETASSLGAKYSVSPSTILNHLRDHDVEIRPRGGQPGRPRNRVSA